MNPHKHYQQQLTDLNRSLLEKGRKRQHKAVFLHDNALAEQCFGSYEDVKKMTRWMVRSKVGAVFTNYLRDGGNVQQAMEHSLNKVFLSFFQIKRVFLEEKNPHLILVQLVHNIMWTPLLCHGETLIYSVINYLCTAFHSYEQHNTVTKHMQHISSFRFYGWG